MYYFLVFGKLVFWEPQKGRGPVATRDSLGWSAGWSAEQLGHVLNAGRTRRISPMMEQSCQSVLRFNQTSSRSCFMRLSSRPREWPSLEKMGSKNSS